MTAHGATDARENLVPLPLRNHLGLESRRTSLRLAFTLRDQLQQPLRRFGERRLARTGDPLVRDTGGMPAGRHDDVAPVPAQVEARELLGEVPYHASGMLEPVMLAPASG